MIPIDHEGLLVCNGCSHSIKYLVENEKPSYKEPPKEVCFYAYKRINHFREILAQFQAKETTQIPDEVLENIKLQGKPVEADGVERAPKDMVTSLPGEVTRIKATFDKPGRYVWHCHILSHEDHEMMRVLHVGPGA